MFKRYTSLPRKARRKKELSNLKIHGANINGKAGGLIIPMSGANSYANSYILKRQMMESFGSILKILYKISDRFVSVNITKITSAPAFLLHFKRINKGIFSIT
jgi:hypothetical protein